MYTSRSTSKSLIFKSFSGVATYVTLFICICPYVYGVCKSPDVVMNLNCATENGLQHCENVVNVAVRVYFQIILLAVVNGVCSYIARNISGRITHVHHNSLQLE